MKHLISRQVDRRELFKAALAQMPYFATLERGVKAISRKSRRSMARDLSKRQYRNARA